MTIHVCDLCKKSSPDAKIKYKYKAERWYQTRWTGCVWKEIELCNECLEKIIYADKEVE